jgi:hypothetical protein
MNSELDAAIRLHAWRRAVERWALTDVEIRATTKSLAPRRANLGAGNAPARREASFERYVRFHTAGRYDRNAVREPLRPLRDCLR